MHLGAFIHYEICGYCVLGWLCTSVHANNCYDNHYVYHLDTCFSLILFLFQLKHKAIAMLLLLLLLLLLLFSMHNVVRIIRLRITKLYNSMVQSSVFTQDSGPAGVFNYHPHSRCVTELALPRNPASNPIMVTTSFDGTVRLGHFEKGVFEQVRWNNSICWLFPGGVKLRKVSFLPSNP